MALLALISIGTSLPRLLERNEPTEMKSLSRFVLALFDGHSLTHEELTEVGKLFAADEGSSYEELRQHVTELMTTFHWINNDGLVVLDLSHDMVRRIACTIEIYYPGDETLSSLLQHGQRYLVLHPHHPPRLAPGDSQSRLVTHSPPMTPVARSPPSLHSSPTTPPLTPVSFTLIKHDRLASLAATARDLGQTHDDSCCVCLTSVALVKCAGCCNFLCANCLPLLREQPCPVCRRSSSELAIFRERAYYDEKERIAWSSIISLASEHRYALDYETLGTMLLRDEPILAIDSLTRSVGFNEVECQVILSRGILAPKAFKQWVLGSLLALMPNDRRVEILYQLARIIECRARRTES
jgi:hypothetical protein